MEAIAREAGIAKPTLYAYFPEKGAIFSALLTQLIATWREDFLAALHGNGEVVGRVGAALTAKYKGLMRLVAASPHAEELYGVGDRLSTSELRRLDDELAAALEAELSRAGVARSRLVAQLLLAAAYGIGHKAQSPAELGPALRLLAERLIRPELPGP
jgi:AcrR family transcriptional regulator